MSTVVLLNPFTSAKYLSDEFKKANIFTLALFTIDKEKISPYFRPDENLFDKQIFLETTDIEKITTTIKKYNPHYIINGSEAITQVTDILTSNLLPNLANDPATTHLRANKFYMQEALKDSHLPYIHQQQININELDKLDLTTFQFPCFCKPVNGLASIGAFKANTPDDLIKNIKSATQNNIYFEAFEYLIQKYIEGEELFVDTFSVNGQHYISSVQKYTKHLINNIPVYRCYELIISQDIWDKATAFVKKCLDATNFKNGFAHTEIFMCKDGEFNLIEINPRISGSKGYHNKITKVVNLKSQTDLLIDFLSGKNLQESLLTNVHGYAKGLILFNFLDRPLRDPSEKLKQFSTLYSYNLIKPVGEYSSANKALIDVDLIVLLYGKNQNQVEQDASAILELEQSGNLL